MQKLTEQYNKIKKDLIIRLDNFKVLSEEDKFKEFLFCLLTPQSNAQRCWQAVEQISQLEKLDEKSVYDILKTKTRFHKTKTLRIMNSKEMWQNIQKYLKDQTGKELRNSIAKTVNGYGLKEAGHFLRNIGLSDNKIAILDRHILRNLQNFNVISESKIKSSKNYLEIEEAYLNFANSINIPADHLDMLWWSQENGEIFK